MKSRMITRLNSWIVLGLPILIMTAATQSHSSAQSQQTGLLKSGFIFEQAPFPSSHASTIVETREGKLVAAWFGGTQERALDVSIWVSRFEGGKWTAPDEVARGIEENGLRRYPCWNPVLFQPKFGPLLLFYKVGPSPENWWGLITTSDNQGYTWAEPRHLPKGYLGPVRNKPVELPEGWLLCGSSTEDAGWRVHMEWLRSPGRDFGRTKPLNNAREFAAIQPTILVHHSGKIQILCRSKQGRILESWSEGNVRQWSPLQRTSLPNPSSSVDAVVLEDGRALLVYNHSRDDRGVLNVALSRDGKKWEAALVLENTPGSEFSYPAVIQTRDGLVHVTYTWRRQRIKHAVLDPSQLQTRPIIDSEWPAR
jgi:predicted neuraminidase